VTASIGVYKLDKLVSRETGIMIKSNVRILLCTEAEVSAYLTYLCFFTLLYLKTSQMILG